jgi:predicted DCC family thiol-disulfide oxidoreductase YuxK
MVANNVLIQITLLLIFFYNIASFRVGNRFTTSKTSQLKIYSTPSTELPSTEPLQQIDLLFDSECPICAMEVEFLRKRDFDNKIKFTDLSSPAYNPADHGNVQFIDGMRKIRAVLPDQTVVVGVEVFRRTYKAIGLGWIFEITNVPVIGKAADALYDLWAENRLRITGRGDMADIL